MTRFLPLPISSTAQITCLYGALIEAYNSQGYPSTFLVGPDGNIVGKNLHGGQLEAEMRKIGALKRR